MQIPTILKKMSRTSNDFYSNERLRRSQKDLEEINVLKEVIPTFTFVTDGNPTTPMHYIFVVTLRSPIGVEGDIISYAENFMFEIILPQKYPYHTPQCAVFPVPFHPHFTKSGLWAEDTSYEPNAGLGLFLLRIMHSLQYDPDYIQEKGRIGNKAALIWYRSYKACFPERFPIDCSPLPTTLSASGRALARRATQSVIQTAPPLPSPEVTPQTEAARPRKTFVITQTTPTYHPKEQSQPAFNTVMVSNGHTLRTSHALYIQPGAREQIFEHINWGRVSPANGTEQGGILLGRVFRDPASSLTYGVVETAIAGEAAHTSSVSLEMDHETWKGMLDQVDGMLAEQSDQDVRIIGWYHTHPNTLDVFMSSTDCATQSRLFAQDWQFAVVLNPHRCMWAVFQGKDAAACPGFMIAAPGERPSPGVVHPQPVNRRRASLTMRKAEGFNISHKHTQKQLLIIGGSIIILLGFLFFLYSTFIRQFTGNARTKEPLVERLKKDGDSLRNENITGKKGVMRSANEPSAMLVEREQLSIQLSSNNVVCQSSIQLGERDSKLLNSAFNFAEQKTVPSKDIDADIIFDADSRKFYSSRASLFALVEGDFNTIKRLGRNVRFQEKEIEISLQHIIVLKTRDENYVKLFVEATGGDPPNRFIKLKYCYQKRTGVPEFE